MKISSWHKSQGDSVEFYMPFSNRYDTVYISKIFSWSEDYKDAINADSVICGGTGYQIDNLDGSEFFNTNPSFANRIFLDKLPEHIEHIYPDYSLYPTLCKDTAYGFLTRGCPRGCSFCHVAAKEGRCSKKVADLSEFWNGQKNIVLCDPNILACRDWKELLQQLIDSKARIDLNQGLDARMLTNEKCEMLRQMKIKQIHFAWDRYRDKDVILPKLQMFSEYKYAGLHKDHNAIVYVLVNFDTTIEQDLERIYTLRDMGYWAYVMIYDKAHASRTHRHMARWCNNRKIFAKCPRFDDYLCL
jgi:hypothetical protein